MIKPLSCKEALESFSAKALLIGGGPVLALRSRLFIISYAPLFIILALQNWPTKIGANWSTVFAVLLILTFFVGIFDAINIIKGARKTTFFDLEITDIQDEGSNAAGYLATYIIPFIGADLTKWTEAASYAVYFSVIYVIFVRSNFGLTNPTLYLLGWRVFQAKTTLGPSNQPRTITIVCKKKPAEGFVSVARTTDGYVLRES